VSQTEHAIRVAGLGKRYTLGESSHSRSLRETLADAARRPWRRSERSNGLDNAEKREIWSLKDVSFDVPAGAVIGVIGRNGAGKSTLLKILSRITEPTTGRVEIRGRVGSLLEVGTGFHQELTGRENIYLNGAILGMRKAEIDRRFDEIVAFAEVERFLDTPVKRYSSGMYVRLAFGVAAHLEPEILLVDEVLAVGDVGFQRKSLGKMSDVAKEGRTILFVSHNMAAIQALCPEALLLEQGSLVARGPSNQVVAEYLQRTDRLYQTATSELGLLPRGHGYRRILEEGLLNGELLAGEHTFLAGADLHFRFVVRLPELMRGCTVGVHFDDELGARVYAANSRWHLRPVELPRGDHVFECHIPELPLVPGRYHLSIGFSSQDEQIDWLERVASVELARTDVYGTGELPQVGQGYFLTRAEWQITPAGVAVS
jgi:lipopolysaccharide transport system ATP-binding protein